MTTAEGSRCQALRAGTAAWDVSSRVAEAQLHIAQTLLCRTAIASSGPANSKSLQQEKQRLAIIIALSFVLILVLLYGLYNSLRDSLLALVNIRFAIAGGAIGLLVRGLDFGISAAVGLVSLLGVSVMNAWSLTPHIEVRAEHTQRRGAWSRPAVHIPRHTCSGFLEAARCLQSKRGGDFWRIAGLTFMALTVRRHPRSLPRSQILRTLHRSQIGSCSADP